MTDFKQFSLLVERAIHKYNQLEKIKRTYGTDILLSRSEIHTIAVVGDCPNINVTILAEKRGVTKGAASQMIYKLVDKGFIEKSVSPSSDNEVCLKLTALGKTAYENHQDYHKNTNNAFFESVHNISDKTMIEVERLFTEFEKAIDEQLKK